MLSLVLRFNLLRNNIRTSCPVRFLKQHAGFSSGLMSQDVFLFCTCSVMFFQYYWHIFEVAKLLASQFCGLLIMQKVLMSLSLTKSLTVVQPRFLQIGYLSTVFV